jgi:hypothetical protein
MRVVALGAAPLVGTNTAQWVEAIATSFAAVGTIGAVVVALWQVSRQGKRQVRAECSLAVISTDSNGLPVVALRTTNVGYRPVKLSMAYLSADDGRTIVSPVVRQYSERLPATLSDGESDEVFWEQN